MLHLQPLLETQLDSTRHLQAQQVGPKQHCFQGRFQRLAFWFLTAAKEDRSQLQDAVLMLHGLICKSHESL